MKTRLGYEMDKSCDIAIKYKSTGETISYTGQIPGESWKALLKFHDEVDKLSTVLEKCENIGITFDLQWSRDGNALKLVVRKSIDSRDLESILHRLRPFILNDEPFEFNRMVNLLQRYMRYDGVLEYTDFLKNIFSGKDPQSCAKVVYERLGESGELEESHVVNSEKILWTWLNAYEYHRDDDKQKLIEKIDEVLPEGLSRILFQAMIKDKIEAIFRFKGVISGIKDKGIYRILM